MLSPAAIEAIIAKLKWAEAELQLVMGEMDREAASDLRSVIETLHEAILQLQQ
jgi:hypothetical protein